MAQIALTGSIYSTLAITIERYLIVCHPFYTVSHKWSAKRYIIPIVAWSLLYNSPKFFELHTTYNETMANQTKNGYDVDAADFRLNEYYIKIYCVWMNFIFMGLIPFVALILLNAQTLRSLILQVRRYINTLYVSVHAMHQNISWKMMHIVSRNFWIPWKLDYWEFRGDSGPREFSITRKIRKIMIGKKRLKKMHFLMI